MNVSKLRISFLLLVMLLLAGCKHGNKTNDSLSPEQSEAKQIEADINRCVDNIEQTLHSHPDSNFLAAADNELSCCMWPGILWMGTEADESRQEAFGVAALQYAASLAPRIQQHASNPKLGLMAVASHLKGYELTESDEYQELLSSVADKLSDYYSQPAADRSDLAGMQLLFWASKHGGNPLHFMTAHKHTEQAMSLVQTDTVIDEQAWAAYGYTMAYKETSNKRFLQQAVLAADVYLQHLPQDMIPLVGTTQERDILTACVALSALADLSNMVQDEELAVRYHEASIQTLASLRTDDTLQKTLDGSNICAEYYYLEALLKVRK